MQQQISIVMNPSSVIGREEELDTISRLYESGRSEFLAIYGRRRVGKSFLIEEALENKFSFVAVGLYQKIDHDNPEKVESYRQKQLAHFHNSLVEYGLSKTNPAPNSWMEALNLLKKLLQSKRARRKVVFIDELPWLAGPQSAELLAELGHFWNSWASWRDDIKLIVCGSATSWIINNLIKNRGGLHNRVTHKIPLKPFTLKECREFFIAKGFRLSNKQIAECYMVLGGVPFYLEKLNKGEGMAQNIDRLLFDEEGELHDEFQSLYNSLYKNATNHIKIVTALATKGHGLTRQELIEKTKLSANGKFSLMLEELKSCGFIRSYEPYLSVNTRSRETGTIDHQSPVTLYQLVDPFTLFHFQVMRKADAHDPNYWSNNQNSHVYSTWSGLSFEMLCLNHVEQIKMALGISGITANAFSWLGKGKDRSAQIDLLIDRADKTINICEMKFYNKPYAMTAKDEDDIERKVSSFIEATHTDKNIIVTMITAKGLERNEHSEGVQKELTLDQLFC